MAEEEDEEEVSDQKPSIEAKCQATTKCARLLVEYKACAERIEAKGEGTCTGQYMDLAGCIDHCVAHNLFDKLT